MQSEVYQALKQDHILTLCSILFLAVSPCSLNTLSLPTLSNHFHTKMDNANSINPDTIPFTIRSYVDSN